MGVRGLDQAALVLHFTIHAEKRAIDRNVSIEEATDVIHTGRRAMEDGTGDRGGQIWQFSKRVRNRQIVCVCEVLQMKCYVLTIKPGQNG